MTLNILELIEKYPFAGSVLLIAMLIFYQTIKLKKGNYDVTRIERENNKLAKQTSETVNRCSERTTAVMDTAKELMESISEHLETDDIGRVSRRLDDTVQMLAKMGEHQALCLRTLDGVAGLLRSVADDLQKTDSRIVHAEIQSKINVVEALVQDVKRIVLA